MNKTLHLGFRADLALWEASCVRSVFLKLCLHAWICHTALTLLPAEFLLFFPCFVIFSAESVRKNSLLLNFDWRGWCTLESCSWWNLPVEVNSSKGSAEKQHAWMLSLRIHHTPSYHSDGLYSPRRDYEKKYLTYFEHVGTKRPWFLHLAFLISVLIFFFHTRDKNPQSASRQRPKLIKILFVEVLHP